MVHIKREGGCELTVGRNGGWLVGYAGCVGSVAEVNQCGGDGGGGCGDGRGTAPGHITAANAAVTVRFARFASATEREKIVSRVNATQQALVRCPESELF